MRGLAMTDELEACASRTGSGAGMVRRAACWIAPASRKWSATLTG